MIWICFSIFSLCSGMTIWRWLMSLVLSAFMFVSWLCFKFISHGKWMLYWNVGPIQWLMWCPLLFFSCFSMVIIIRIIVGRFMVLPWTVPPSRAVKRPHFRCAPNGIVDHFPSLDMGRYGSHDQCGWYGSTDHSTRINPGSMIKTRTQMGYDRGLKNKNSYRSWGYKQQWQR